MAFLTNQSTAKADAPLLSKKTEGTEGEFLNAFEAREEQKLVWREFRLLFT